MQPTVELTVISGDSTREEVREAIAHCNASAKRTPARDSLSRLNPDHARMHAFLNYLIDLDRALT